MSDAVYDNPAVYGNMSDAVYDNPAVYGNISGDIRTVILLCTVICQMLCTIILLCTVICEILCTIILLCTAPHPRTPHQSLTISSNTFNMDLIDTIRNVSKRYARRPIKWPWKKLNTTTPSSSTTPSTTTMGPTSPETISSVIDGFYNVSDCLDGNCSWASLDNITDVWADSTLCEGSGTTTDFIVMMITAFVLGVIILSTVIGNVFVIAAILLERNLQNVANYLILSLAVADLLVACLVMPLGAVYEVSRQWTLGPELCDMWTSSDVLCCTASILHLVAIALDR
ncbi:5-hydroxytryptamine receptor-like [Diaphorina citri]|uniref:5-hydroxytryptamine receptor-like n=1 Tax=Diaphorina citri TaxID=121845 RepID=A0A3Q0IXT6_DIACI|nr:5-hydroxytryptamine receptor-like [Diaphorina citri]